MRRYALPIALFVVFEAATIHYAVAKIFGPLLFGRGWCGYACWTTMVLDFLPHAVSQGPRGKIGWIRYAMFVASLVFVASLFLAHVGNIEQIMFWAFVVGNITYYAIGIALEHASSNVFPMKSMVSRLAQITSRLSAPLQPEK